MFEKIEQVKEDLNNDNGVQKKGVNESFFAKGGDMYDSDGDGKESVTEYIEKKKMSSDAKAAEEEQKKKEKKNKKNKSDEDLEKLGNAVGKVTSVVSSIPHFAAFGLGMGAGGVAEKLREMMKWNK